ncbi:hypothetical protein N181_31890 [Sinorhizobium fredii USDA 205]|uniref:Uncharacterized protein n=2 Tax=Rhizobium fredii TaxID=380 RepID=A0A844A2S6_RHIFR|nr:hypothetical protein [Sinorhizobium fredii]KSV89700.1 hypothetical protein N181_31890 [Sinorhizobium fredii USDA 205]MQX07263.1 hypothetical protein [Sinorhizobium fredii]GEC35922.1 hypothetical protein EFR01_60930 [Sinorhizobium fredii]GLS09444.1 hypothetical protein GCM10007864_30740 [Sinorhizobium fredii]
MPPTFTVAQLLDICGSSTVSEATTKGDALGWERMNDEQVEEWRAGFLAHNGGSVDLVGWRRGEKEGDGMLSFWIAKGPNGHKACSYSVTNPAGLLDALTQRFGPPSSLDKMDFGSVAYWKHSATEVSFSQVGSSTGVTIAYKD